MRMQMIWCMVLYFFGARADITQTSSLVLKEDENATLTCSQNNNHDYMYWYLQQPGKGLQLVYYSYIANQEFQGDIHIGYNAKRLSQEVFHLDLISVKKNHSATYFCATSLDTTLQSHLVSVHKLLSGIFPRRGIALSTGKGSSSQHIIMMRGDYISRNPAMFLLEYSQCSGLGYTITQWPEDALRRAGENVDLTCYQNWSTLPFMFWYQQPSRSSLKLIVSTSIWMQNSFEEGYSEAKFDVWHGAEERYSMIEKQLLAAYSTLQVVEPTTQTAKVIVKTALPIQGWVRDLIHLPKTGVAQAQVVARWVAYLSQRSSLSSSLLKEELQKTLGPVTYHSDAPKQTLVAPPQKSPVQEGKYPIPEDAWYMDGSSKGNPSKWRAVVYHPDTDTIWFEEGHGQSSQWAELRAVWMVITKEPGDVVIQWYVIVTNNRMIFDDGTKLTLIGKNDAIIPPAVAIFSPSKQEIQQKNKATLVCLASGFYPDQLSLVWKVNGVKRTEGVGTDEMSTSRGSTYALTSRLRISAQEWFNPLNRFECIAEFFKNETLESIHKFIYGDAGCDIFRENYQRSATAGKFVYIMLIFKSILYGIFVMGMMLWYKKMY
ncbi:uncharacterized protein LOC136052867 [Cyrtonyx montezumae]|uniref:uncharacterized protein LOC136052867 n=1 Tax=Cyrtonyx montezumae TaxID=9017 RepID=UPI0032D9E189